MTPSAAALLVVLRAWLPLIVAEARSTDEAATLAAIVYQESRGQAHLVSRERNGSCSVGLGMVNVPDCDPDRIQRLRDPGVNIRISAKILRDNERWCRKHRRERRCRAGERVFRGGGGTNLYAGNTTAYAELIGKLRKRTRPIVLAAARRVGASYGARVVPRAERLPAKKAGEEEKGRRARAR